VLKLKLRGLLHARQVLCHWTTLPAPIL
jgi:hypothetical protein